jgi:hypothetical protein
MNNDTTILTTKYVTEAIPKTFPNYKPYAHNSKGYE